MKTNQIAKDNQLSEGKSQQQLTENDNKNSNLNTEVNNTEENEEEPNETFFAEGRGRVGSRQEAIGTRSQYRSVRSLHNYPALQAEVYF